MREPETVSERVGRRRMKKKKKKKKREDINGRGRNKKGMRRWKKECKEERDGGKVERGVEGTQRMRER